MKVKFYSALPITWVLLLSFVIANITFANTTQSIDVPSFTGVSLSNSYDVFIEQGRKQKVRAEGPQELIDKISTEVKNGVWTIKNKAKKNYSRNWETGKEKVTIYITLPTLTSATLAGSGSIKISEFDTGDFKTSISGSGNITAVINGDDISAKIAGSGKINISGKAQSLSAAISGSGNINGIDLMVSECSAKIAGSGNIKIHATNDINASITGSGSVYYNGNPSISKRITGSGSVRKARAK